MRTTIEMSDETLRRLRELAARRGKRGYSELIEDAVKRFLSESEVGPASGEFVDPFEGVWSDQEAEVVRERIKESRKSWR